MSGSVNKVTLVGALGRDPEVRSTQDGTKIVNLSIATSERWKDKSGERQERTEWHRVVIFNEKIGEVAERYLRKGNSVYIEGALQTRKWTDKDGQERTSTEVVLQKFRGELVLLGGREQGAGQDQGYEAPTPRPGATAARPAPSKPRGASIADDLDDEIPFAVLLPMLISLGATLLGVA